MHSARAQSAIELISTYSWALLVIAIFVAAVLLLANASQNQQSLAFKCSIQPLLPCQDSVLVSSYVGKPIIYYVEFVNNFQTPLDFPANAFVATVSGVGQIQRANYTGSCTPAFALRGSRVLCQLNITGPIVPPAGTQVNTLFAINYSICSNTSIGSCSSQVYRTSGFGTQTIAPSALKFIAVTLEANDLDGSLNTTIGTNGIIYIDGVPYAGGQKVFLTSTGNYEISTQAPSGFYFSTWNVISTGGTASSVAPLNGITATLMLHANATLNANFTNLACNVCAAACIRLPGAVCAYNCPTHATAVPYPDGSEEHCATCTSGFYKYACVR